MIKIGNYVINSQYIVSVMHNQSADNPCITVVTTHGNLDLNFSSYTDMINEFVFFSNRLDS